VRQHVGESAERSQSRNALIPIDSLELATLAVVSPSWLGLHGRGGCRNGNRAEFTDRAQHFAAITEQNPQLFQVLIAQVWKDAEVDALFGKTLGVLGHAEFFEPICNLLHGGPPTVSSWHDGVFDHRNRESTPIYPRYHASHGDFRLRFLSISGPQLGFPFQ
jgi:hypothetical protein